MAINSITGMAQFLSNIHKAQVAARKGAERGVERARLAVESTAKRLILKGPKTGEWYEYGPGDPDGQRKHRASAPGEPPASDTGILAGPGIESKRDGLIAVVWTEKAYGKYLEFGTRDIEPRPWLTPAVEQNKEKYPAELGNAVIQAINEAVKT